MAKIDIYNEIHDKMIRAARLGRTPEGALIIGIMGQAIQDAMGMYGSREKVYLPNTEAGRRGRAKRQWITRKQEATEWLRDGCHYPYADMVGINPTWIDHLIKTKAGVQI